MADQQLAEGRPALVLAVGKLGANQEVVLARVGIERCLLYTSRCV